MKSSILLHLTQFAAVGSGIMAGVFFAFSVFVMAAFARLPAAQGIAAMQSINVTVLTPLFLGVFLSTAAACGVLVIAGCLRWREPGSIALVVGCLFYLGGIIAVTAGANVPRNDALAALQPDSAEAALAWSRFLGSWTAWNHVRTIAGTGALVSFLAAIR